MGRCFCARLRRFIIRRELLLEGESVETGCDNCGNYENDRCSKGHVALDIKNCPRNGYYDWQPIKSCTSCEDEKLDKWKEPCVTCKKSCDLLEWRSVEMVREGVKVDICISCGGANGNHSRGCANEVSGISKCVPCPPKPFTRADLTKEVHQYCDDIKKLFSYKNTDYGMDGDPFANFSKTAERVIVPIMQKNGVQISKRDAMFAVLMVYMDKHLVALSQTGLSGNEVEERLGDVANYALIAKAMLKDGSLI